MKTDKKKFAVTYTLEDSNDVFLDYYYAKSKKHAERNIKRKLGEFGVRIIEIKED